VEDQARLEQLSTALSRDESVMALITRSDDLIGLTRASGVAIAANGRKVTDRTCQNLPNAISGTVSIGSPEGR
jgi:light-regulated signal transduction histidine kinase (bacteriophytochrome)